jgi:hypothetical protein
MAAPAVAQDLEIIKVERVEDLLSCILVGDGRLNDFLGSGQTLNTDDFPYLEYIAPRSAFGSSREGLAPPIYSEFIRCRENVLPYLQDASDSSLESIQQSYDSSSLVLNARLAEMTGPTNHAGIRLILDEALRLDPRNNVAKFLLEQYDSK